jgi:hypothetical protein
VPAGRWVRPGGQHVRDPLVLSGVDLAAGQLLVQDLARPAASGPGRPAPRRETPATAM